MDRKDRKEVSKADEKEISKLMKTETFPKYGADEKTSISKLAKIASGTQKPAKRK